jgi:hypothetical protein
MTRLYGRGAPGTGSPPRPPVVSVPWPGRPPGTPGIPGVPGGGPPRPAPAFAGAAAGGGVVAGLDLVQPATMAAMVTAAVDAMRLFICKRGIGLGFVGQARRGGWRPSLKMLACARIANRFCAVRWAICEAGAVRPLTTEHAASPESHGGLRCAEARLSWGIGLRFLWDCRLGCDSWPPERQSQRKKRSVATIPLTGRDKATPWDSVPSVDSVVDGAPRQPNNSLSARRQSYLHPTQTWRAK